MKKITLLCLLAIGAGFSGFKIASTLNQATVNEVNSYLLFIENKPNEKYKVLGQVKSTFGFGGQFNQVKERLISKAKKDYPNGDGLIFHFVTSGTDYAEVIKFED